MKKQNLDKWMRTYAREDEPYIGPHDPSWQLIHDTLRANLLSLYPERTVLNIACLESGSAYTELHMIFSLIPTYRIGTVVLMDQNYRELSHEQIRRMAQGATYPATVRAGLQNRELSKLARKKALESFLERSKRAGLLQNYVLLPSYAALVEYVRDPGHDVLHYMFSIHPNVGHGSSNRNYSRALLQAYRQSHRRRFGRPAPPVNSYIANSPWYLEQKRSTVQGEQRDVYQFFPDSDDRRFFHALYPKR